jgi:hypothetical protein
MAEQSIISDDITLKRVFQDFYRVPNYQREYVWSESDAKDERGDEVEQFLKDIYGEFSAHQGAAGGGDARVRAYVSRWMNSVNRDRQG